MPSNPAKSFAEAVYFVGVVWLSTWVVREGFLDGDESAEHSLLVQIVIALIAGTLAYIIHALVFAPLHMKVVWHRKNSHNPLEVHDLPLKEDREGDRYACHVSLEPASKLSTPWFWVIRRLGYVPVILSDSPEHVQMSSVSGGVTIYPVEGPTSGVELQWLGQANGRQRLRASAEIAFYIEDPNVVSAGPSPLHYRLERRRQASQLRGKRQLVERVFTMSLRGWVRVISDARNVHLETGV